MLDLRSILALYLSRRYSHLKSVKLCSNLLVKNLCTSDLLFDPGEEPAPRRGLWFLLDGTRRGGVKLLESPRLPLPYDTKQKG